MRGDRGRGGVPAPRRADRPVPDLPARPGLRAGQPGLVPADRHGPEGKAGDPCRTVRYLRYVALGDSQTEGLGDGDDTAGLRGWADRLAEHLAPAQPRASVRQPGRTRTSRRAGPRRTAGARPRPARPTWPPSSPGSTTCCGPGSTPKRSPGHLEAMFAALTAPGRPRRHRHLPRRGADHAARPAAQLPRDRPQRPHPRRGRPARGHGRRDRPTTPSSPTPGCGPRTGSTPAPSATSGSPPPSPTPSTCPAATTPGRSPCRHRRSPRAGKPPAPNCAGPPPSSAPGSARRLRGRSSGDGRTAKRPQLLPLSATPDSPADTGQRESS